MNTGKLVKGAVAVLISLIMTVTMMPVSAFAVDVSAADDKSTDVPDLVEGTFVPGEVIVVFKPGAVKDQKLSVKKAAALENTGEEFGSIMKSTGEEADAAEDAKSEISIIRRSLGDDFVIQDSIAVDDDLIISLIRSEKYTTETLIEKLSGNKDIESVEPNYLTKEQSIEYSLDDELAQYSYHTNSPEYVNKAGKSVTSRGADTAEAISTNAGSVTDFAEDHSSEKEIVVAVVDSGINYDHEELKDKLWINDPEKTGLEGTYGFNFDDNDLDVKDTHGHGTHCSGIIAAQANNGKGVAGVASGVNVKIMMCACTTSNTDPDREINPSIYRRTGALYYVLRAKQAGVNVVAASCSWGSPGGCDSYNHILNKLGEAGVLTFIAASNDSMDNDLDNYSPAGSDSPYTVIVGSARIDGRPSGFTNIGKSNVDVFGPGSNILSAENDSNYFPNLYTAEERAGHTEYYGQFSSGEGGTLVGDYAAELGTNRVVPDTAGEGVKAFSAAKFFVQDVDVDEGGEGESDNPDEDTSCELSISSDRTFTDNYANDSQLKPGSLKVTIKNARYGKKYYLYFPYEKNPSTTGIDNTRYSIDAILQHNDGEFAAEIVGGETVRYNVDGKEYCRILGNESLASNDMYDGEILQCAANTDFSWDRKLLSWEDANAPDVVETGMGISIEPGTNSGEFTDEEKEFIKDPHDVTIYIDALGVSRPITEEGKTPEDVFPADSSYTLMSGTSQATPAVAGAYAVLTSLYPMAEGQNPAAYAFENRSRLLSLVTKTEELKDLCSTGGYIDLSKIKTETADKKNASITDAVCDLNKETLTLKGIGLTKGLKLYTRTLAQKNASEVLIPDSRVTFAADGKSLVISKAKALFGTYTEFILKDAGGAVRTRGSFFTVKGQKALKLVLSEEHKETVLDAPNAEGSINVRQIFTDTEGKNLYAYQPNAEDLDKTRTGILYRYDGNRFVQYQGSGLRDSLFDYYEKKLGYDRHQLTRGFTVSPWVRKQTLVDGNILYELVDVEYSPHKDAEEEEIQRKTYLASLNYTSGQPKWTFKEIQSIEPLKDEIKGYNPDEIAYGLLNGKLYAIGGPSDGTEDLTDDDMVTFVLELDMKSGVWKRLADYKDAMLKKACMYTKDGKTYVMFADTGDGKHSDGVWTFDGKTWKKLAKGIPFCGRHGALENPVAGAVCPVREGFILFNFSVSGAGNTFLYRPDKGTCEPLYYTTTNGLSIAPGIDGAQAAVETKDGLYFISTEVDDGNIYIVNLYLLPKSSHVYKPMYKDANTMTVKVSSKTVKAKKLKKKKVTLKALTVKNAKGKVSYKRSKITCSKKLKKAAKAKIKVNTKTGKITIKKGLKKGKYTVYVKVTAKGDDYYKSMTKTVKTKITVK